MLDSDLSMEDQIQRSVVHRIVSDSVRNEFNVEIFHFDYRVSLGDLRHRKAVAMGGSLVIIHLHIMIEGAKLSIIRNKAQSL